ncbi:hypothetical protein [Streptomyces sp. NBC_01190]|uniref:hypothetical protein n=1 Tax=Streptomyces sp. NBC_01190 TaxID=2903767 RepID=UPI00386F713A|nr:hypothetical protein OG519_08865 [Streptomyces sp. NBC_01190]
MERWTLGGPEPYAVPLPGGRPERPDSQVLPLGDGRVLIGRRTADRHDLVLLHPTGPGTGEVAAGSLTGAEVRLLPPSPAPDTAFALVHDEGATTIWQIHGQGGDGSPVPVMTVEGRCTGGVWLDRAGRLLALDRELDGRTKAVAADLRTGETSPLLQLTEDSDDRLLLAEPDSGLLMLRSDASGEARIGWGVLGSRLPVRFPDALRVPGVLLTPLAAQPGQILAAARTVVALRAEVPGGAESLALWRPGEGRLHWRATPRGWLGPAALWLRGRELRLPYAVPDWPCGLIGYDAPAPAEEAGEGVPVDEGDAPAVAAPVAAPATVSIAPASIVVPAPRAPSSSALADGAGRCSAPLLGREPAAQRPGGARPARRRLAVIPLQEAPLTPAQAG